MSSVIDITIMESGSAAAPELNGYSGQQPTYTVHWSPAEAKFEKSDDGSAEEQISSVEPNDIGEKYDNAEDSAIINEGDGNESLINVTRETSDEIDAIVDDEIDITVAVPPSENEEDITEQTIVHEDNVENEKEQQPSQNDAKEVEEVEEEVDGDEITASSETKPSEEEAILLLKDEEEEEDDEEEEREEEEEAQVQLEDEEFKKRAIEEDETNSDVSDSVSSITFHDLAYEVPQRKRCRRQPNKIILNSVSGEMRTGVNAIMGPTGSGKTTLLDLLADRKDKSGKSGKVLINGHRRQPNYKSVVGYVVQDDLVMGTLSVKENLEFSAALRLPGHMTRAQRKERVERVIETLGLYRCANTKVGTQFFRGVSGGERKRTNIGMELIIEPQVLFLDEPTTGLDANTAVSIISLLKEMSKNEKRLIVLSIHQPRYSIFKLFDSLTLLSHGSVVYHGPTTSALSYFDGIGFKCEEHNNPADFVLDTIIKCETQVRLKSEATIIAMTTNDEEIVFGNGGTVDRTGEDKSIELADRYKESEAYRSLRKRIDPILQNVVDEKKKETVARQSYRKVFSNKVYPTSFPWQYLMVTWRSTRNLLRSPELFVYQLFYSIIISVFAGLVYWQLDTEPNNFNDRIGALNFLAGERAYVAVITIEVFIQNRALFIHENASGYYRVSAFFLSKITTDLLFLRFVPNAIYVTIAYFTIGFQVEVEKFFIFWLILILVQVSAVSLALAISAGLNSGEAAIRLFMLPFIFSLLFGGIFVTLDTIRVWISWLKYVSFMKYGVEALLINEMDGLVFQGPCEIQQVFEDDNLTSLNTTSECVFDGPAQLEQVGFASTTTMLWWNVFALVIYSSIFMTLSYLILRVIKKEK